MGKLSLFEQLEIFIRNFVGRISWLLFLWSIHKTAEQYWKEIYEQEKPYQEP
jgi:hypothetical protein